MDTLIVAAGFALVAVLLWLLWHWLRRTRHLPGIGGEALLYQDDGQQRPLKHPGFNISARPDHIVQEGKDVVVVETKGRGHGPYASDWAQAIAGALAARGSGFPVTKARWTNGQRRVTRALPASDAALFEMIRPYHDQVTAVRAGQPVAFHPDAHKCRTCYYRAVCPRRTH